MALVTELVHTHPYQAVLRNGLIYRATLSARLDEQTRQVRQWDVTNPGPRAIRVVVRGPGDVVQIDQVIPAWTNLQIRNLPVSQQIILARPTDDGVVPDDQTWAVSIGED